MAICSNKHNHADLSVVFVGHVDHGKSSLMGRLLTADSNFRSKVLELEAHCQNSGRRFEHAFLIDALKSERNEGITIDSARVFFSTSGRRYQLIDAPGHLEFLRNMISGASRADLAVLVVDVRNGLETNAIRHLELLPILGVREVIVAINKMDTVGFSVAAFDKTEEEVFSCLEALNLTAKAVIPVSAKAGSNINHPCRQMPWYRGATLLKVLKTVPNPTPLLGKPFRFRIQDHYELSPGTQTFVGTIHSGTVERGSALKSYPGEQSVSLETLIQFGRSPTSLGAGAAAGFALKGKHPPGVGDMLCKASEPPPVVGSAFQSTIFWIGREPLTHGKSYTLKIGALHTPVFFNNASPVAMRKTQSKRKQSDGLLRCQLRTLLPIACDLYGSLAETSRFVIYADHQIVGGGVIEHRLPRSETPPVIWLTGFSGAGKTTIASTLEGSLRKQGYPVRCIDGDELRSQKRRGFGEKGRKANMRHAAALAKKAQAEGHFVIVSLISPYRKTRQVIASKIKHFVEVHVATPLAVCEARDPKGLYKRARRGDISQLTGIDSPYEAPLNPSLSLNTDKESTHTTHCLATHLKRLGYL